MTAADKPRASGRYTGTRGDAGWTPCWACKRPHNEHRPEPAGAGDGLACPADRPRADLVALLLQFEACARDGRMTSLYLSGDDAGAAIRAWADLRGHHVVIGKMTRPHDGRNLIEFTHYTVQDPGDAICPAWTVTCCLHDDHEVTAPPAQADQAVLARVKAALDGRFRCSVCGTASSGPLGKECPFEHWPVGYAVEIEQPQAAEGSV